MHKEKFESVWDGFVEKFKGKLINKSNSGELSYSYVKLLLNDCVLAWGSRTDIEGSWLSKYKEEYPEKGKLIQKILLEDIFLTEVKASDNSKYVNYIVPVGGAIAGLCVSSFLDASIVVKAISTVVPAALMYPSVKFITNNLSSNKKSQVIDEYISQLEKYKLSILSIVEND